jgi:imidazoleglycerol-phosphate dehydratase
VGDFDTELVEEFFTAFCNHSGANIHVNLAYGDNLHHIIEGIFKAFGRALDEATSIDPRIQGVLSTKGKLE